MKTSQITVPALAVAALAQYTSISTSTSYTTITAYNGYCSGDLGYTSTSTETITSDICTSCEAESATAHSVSSVLTTYKTVYPNVRPTGSSLTMVTYTITEPYPSGSTGKPMPATHMPHGFTTIVATCACEGGSATLTVPASTEAAGSVSPAESGAAGSSPAAGYPAPGSPAGSSDTGSGEEDTTVVSNGTVSTATVPVALASTGTPSRGSPTGGSSPIATGAGSRLAFSMCSALFAVFAGVVYAL